MGCRQRIVGGLSLREQTRQALRNISAAMAAAGGTLADIVAPRIYIVNYQPENTAASSDGLKEAFTDTPPTSTWIGVSSLAVPEFLIEIEATAVLD